MEPQRETSQPEPNILENAPEIQKELVDSEIETEIERMLLEMRVRLKQMHQLQIDIDRLKSETRTLLSQMRAG